LILLCHNELRERKSNIKSNTKIFFAELTESYPHLTSFRRIFQHFEHRRAPNGPASPIRSRWSLCAGVWRKTKTNIKQREICPASPDFSIVFALLFSLFSFLFFISFLTKNALLFSQPMY